MFLKAKQGGEINKTCQHNLMQHKNNWTAWVFIHHFLKKCLTFFVFILDRNETTQQKTNSGYCFCSQCASIFTLAPVVFVLRHECDQYLHTQGWYTFTYNILFKWYRLSDWLHVEQLRFAPPAPAPPPQSPPPTYLQSVVCTHPWEPRFRCNRLTSIHSWPVCPVQLTFSNCRGNQYLELKRSSGKLLESLT